MIRKIIIFIFLLNLLLLGFTIKSMEDPRFRIYFLDVGQGDAIYIRTPEKQDILIDGGPSAVVLSKLGDIMPFYDREIDVVVLTHPHADHVTGLISVLEKYKVRQVYLTGATHTTSEYVEFLRMLSNSTETQKIKVDHKFALRLSEGSKLEFLYPDFDVNNPEEDQLAIIKNNLNNTSVAVKLIYKNNQFLLTGDMEQEVEGYLLGLSCNPVLQATHLKAGHHGSKTSSTVEFLQAVNPDIVIVSVGADNRFGHPNQNIINRFKDLGIHIFRTDIDGDIAFEF